MKRKEFTNGTVKVVRLPPGQRPTGIELVEVAAGDKSGNAEVSVVDGPSAAANDAPSTECDAALAARLAQEEVLTPKGVLVGFFAHNLAG